MLDDLRYSSDMLVIFGVMIKRFVLNRIVFKSHDLYKNVVNLHWNRKHLMDCFYV